MLKLSLIFGVLLILGIHSSSAVEILDQAAMSKITSKKLNELSGIIPASRANMYWGINDANNDPVLFGFTRSGIITHEIRLNGTQNIDWEAITRDSSGNLYIADFGDNKEKRSDYSIYQLPEPITQKPVPIIQYPFQYADGKSRNCESLFIWNNQFYLISKEEDEDDTPQVFRISELNHSSMNQAHYVSDLSFTGRITDAAYSEEIGLLAVLSREHITFLTINDENDFSQTPIKQIPVDKGKCEGVCFEGNSVIVTNEKGEIWVYSIQDLLKN